MKKEASQIRQDGSNILPKSSKLGPKIHQVGAQNPPKSVPEALLDGSGRHLGPSWLQEPRRTRKSTNNSPKMVPTWKPKSAKNRFKGDLKCDQFCDGFGNDFLERLVAKLGPTWEPKPSQNGAKLGPKSKQEGIQSNLKQKYKKCQKCNTYHTFGGSEPPSWSYVGAMLGLCWGYAGLCGAMLGACWAKM